MKKLNLKEVIYHIFKRSDLEYIILGNPEFLRNEVLLIKELNVILKIYGNKLRWRREINALSMFQKESFSPKLFSFGMYEDYGWTIISYLEGELLESILMHTTNSEKKEILFDLGVFLCFLHDNTKIIEGSEYVLCEQPVIMNSHQYTYSRYKKDKEKILMEGSNFRHFFSSFSFVEEVYWSIVKEGEGYLSYFHNDFGARNIIVNEGNFYLIDFESGYFSCREFDLANIFLEYYDNQIMRESFINGYCSNGYKIRCAKLVLFLVLKCIDICSWAKTIDKIYYDKAELILINLSHNEWKL